MTAYCVNEIGIDQLLADVMTQHPVHTRNKMLRVLLSQLSSEKNPISPTQATPYPAGSVFCRKSYSKVEELCWRAARIPPAALGSTCLVNQQSEVVDLPGSLMPLLPVRSTSCKAEAGARRPCR